MYLLDTNTCIRFLNGSSANVLKHFQQCSPDEIALCSVVKAELWFGARHSQQVERNLQRLHAFFTPLQSLSFDDRSAEEYGQIRADLSRQGTIIGPNDLFIAAIAKSHDATLVTHNHKEFMRVTGLRLADWESE